MKSLVSLSIALLLLLAAQGVSAGELDAGESIAIRIVDRLGHPLPAAKVKIEIEGKSPLHGRYVRKLGAFVVDAPWPDGRMMISLSCPGYRSMRLPLRRNGQQPGIPGIAMARTSEELLYQGGPPRPFLPHNDVICVATVPLDSERLAAYTRLLRDLDLVEIPHFVTDSTDLLSSLRYGGGQTVEELGYRFLRRKDGAPFSRSDSRELRALRRGGVVGYVGMVVTVTTMDLHAFDNQLVVEPEPGFRYDSMLVLLARFGFTGPAVFANGGFYYVRTGPEVGIGILDIAGELLATGKFRSVWTVGTAIIRRASNTRALPQDEKIPAKAERYRDDQQDRAGDRGDDEGGRNLRFRVGNRCCVGTRKGVDTVALAHD